MNNSLIINISNYRDTRDFVLLEQEPWDPYTGYITKFALYQFINHLMFQGKPPEPKCPILAPRTIYAYPSRPDLQYFADCSWGELGPRQVFELEFREVIQCNLKSELETRYPALSITNFSWVGGAWSRDGEALNQPNVQIDDKKIVLSQRVYGTLVVFYKVCVHKYSLSIKPRPGAIENKIQSHVYAIWNGGNKVIEIKHPDGTEDGECNYNIDYELDIPDDYQPPDHVDPEDEYADIDYCTGLEAV